MKVIVLNYDSILDHKFNVKFSSPTAAVKFQGTVWLELIKLDPVKLELVSLTSIIDSSNP